MLRFILPLSVIVLLGSCSGSSLVSPSSEVQNETINTATADRRIGVQVHSIARLMRSIGGQQFAQIDVRARCPVGYEPMEEPLTLTQEHGAFGQGGFGMTCTGRWERRTFRVFASEVEFRRGRASFNVALQVENPQTGELLTASDRGFINLR